MARKTGFGKYSQYFNNTIEVIKLLTNEYQIYPVVTTELQRAAAAVRHNVYCTELGYEAAAQEGIESDIYDGHSTQVILKRRSIDSYMGCARLIHAQTDGKTIPLPFETICTENMNWDLINKIKTSGKKYAEISRLSIERTHRSDGSKSLRAGAVTQMGLSMAALALYMGLGALGRHHDIQYGFAVIEPRLFRSIQRSGIPIQQIGDAVHFRGKRIPVLISLDQFENSIPFVLWPLYRSICNNIKKVSNVAQARAQEMLELGVTPLLEEVPLNNTLLKV